MATPGAIGRGTTSPSAGDLGKAGTFGTIGSIAGMLSGVPGLGIAGSIAGALADEDTAEAIGKAKGLTSDDTATFDPVSAATNAGTFGLAGKTMSSQLGHAVNAFDARQAVSDVNQALSSKASLSPPSLAPTQVSAPLSRTAVPAQGTPTGASSSAGSSAGNSGASAAGGGFGGASGVAGPGTAGAPGGAAHGRTSRGANSAGAGGTGSDPKVVCSAMNQAYGFGAFRQAIWLRHSQGLHPAYQRGYHRLFRPLVGRAYGKPNALASRSLRGGLEFIARARTADLWRQQRGSIFWPGRMLRLVLEPLCFLAGLPK